MASATRGFSLIEMLLVVAIIAILASLLMPAVGVVREQAKTAVCAGQLRQLGMGFYSYASDHHGTLPPAMANPNTTWWTKTYAGLKNGFGALFGDYIDDPRVAVCPGFNLNNGYGNFASIRAYASAGHTGYRYNGNPWDDSPSTSLYWFTDPSVRNYISHGWPTGIDRFRNSNGAGAGGVVLAYDGISENTSTKGVYHPHPSERITRTWGYLPLVKGGNVLFCDGRVEFLAGSNWRAENGTMTSGSYYCPLRGY